VMFMIALLRHLQVSIKCVVVVACYL